MGPRTEDDALTEHPPRPAEQGAGTARRRGDRRPGRARLAHDAPASTTAWGRSDVVVLPPRRHEEAILDGIVEVVRGEMLAAAEQMYAPAPEVDWQAARRARILAARDVLLRHRWTPRVLGAPGASCVT